MSADDVTAEDHDRTVAALVGVYDADGTVMGELSYFVGARLGRAHCSLCDITHGLFRAKPAWTECREVLPVSFTTYHRNDAPAAVLEAIGGRLPAVVAETAGGAVVVLLGRDQLEACDGSLDEMLRLLMPSAESHGLALDLVP